MANQDILEVLEKNFGTVKVKGDYAYINSPFNSLDKTPSCAVTIRDGKFGVGFFKDFSTGRSGNIYSLLKIPHDYGKLNKHKKLTQLNSPMTVKFHMSRFEYKASKYLFERGISYEVQERFRVYEAIDRVSMPVFDEDGYFLYDVSRLTNKKGYANSETTNSYPALMHDVGLSDMVFVCESMIDAFSIFSVGLKAISLNGAGNHKRLAELLKEHCGTIVLALDPDEVGQMNADLILGSLRDKDVVNLELPYDVNDCLVKMIDAMGRDVAYVRFNEFLLRTVGLRRGVEWRAK